MMGLMPRVARIIIISSQGGELAKSMACHKNCLITSILISNPVRVNCVIHRFRVDKINVPVER